MIGQLHNNIALISLSMSFVINHMHSVSTTKALLIAPIVSSSELLSYLARKTTKTHSVEQLIAKKTRCVSNFSSRYYDNLTTSINAIQLLADLERINFSDGIIKLVDQVDYHPSMGKRVYNIFKASSNIAQLLEAPKEVLYVNLRVQL